MGEKDVQYWSNFKNELIPLVLVDDGSGGIGGTPYDVFSEGCWRMTFKVRDQVSSKVELVFNNGETYIMTRNETLVLDGQPYIQQNNKIKVTVSSAVVLVLREVIRPNKERK